MDFAAYIAGFDLESYLENFETRRGGQSEFLMQCPSCHKDNLSVSTRHKVFRCWSCNHQGGLIDLISMLSKISKREAADRIRGATPNPSSQQQKHTPEHTGPWMPIEPPDNCQRVEKLLPYMEKRGLTLEDANRHRLMHTVGGKQSNRLVFPVYDTRGQLIFWQARAMFEARSERHIKTLNPPRLLGCAGASDVIFNGVGAGRGQLVHVCEGPIDAIISGGIAVFGKRIFPQQIEALIKRGVTRVNVLLDSDAHDAAQKMAQTLSSFFDTYLTLLPEGDPADLGREALNTHIDKLMRPAVAAPTISVGAI